MDESGKLWTWANWAEAGLLTSEWLNQPGLRMKDMAAGWHFSAVLTTREDSDVQHVWVWYERFLSPSLQGWSSGTMIVEGRQACFTWEPQSLRLPDLTPAGDTVMELNPSQRDLSERIESIAAGDDFIVALTNLGRMYRINVMPPPRHPLQQLEDQGAPEEQYDNGRLTSRQLAELENLFASGRRVWEHFPLFSHPEKRINFISANFLNFFAIGDGVVLQGHKDMTPLSQPLIRPELQDKGVIR